eukprot:740539_1
MARLSVATLGSEVTGAVNHRFSVGMSDMGQSDVATMCTALKEKSSFSNLCSYSLNTLGKLVQDEKLLKLFMDSEGVENVLGVFQEHPTNPRIIKEGVEPLLAAAQVPEFAQKMAEAGVMEFCIEHLKKSSDSGIRLNLVRLLEAMCANNPDNVRKLAAMDGFGTLAKCARDARLYDDHKLADHSMKLMAMITKEPSEAAKVSSFNALAITNIVENFAIHATVVESGMEILLRVGMENDDVAIALKQHGIVSVLTQVMELHPTEPSIMLGGRDALAFLSTESDLVGALARMDESGISDMSRQK